MTRPLPSETGRPLVIAHRGASAYRPENTLPAYALAVEQRADMIEIDLHTTRDGRVVVAHDAELGRIGGTGEIAEASLAELRKLDAGAGERVPSLDEVLDGFAQKLPFNLELKRSTTGAYPGLEQACLRAVETRGVLSRTLFSCFDDGVLSELRARSAAARIALLLSPRSAGKALERAARVGAEAVNPHFVLAEEGLIREAHSAGLAVYVYTVDDARQMEELVDRGVDGLFTNRPDRMRAMLDAREAPPASSA